ncbi:MAG: 30S ribosomal protein S12 methylthiotransferase RimO [Bacteroidota bacterium]
MTVNVITLGCSKNLVDSEHLLAQFRGSGFQVMHNREDQLADIVIINTCGFILDAKEESVSTILYYADLKKEGRIRKLFVMGCLSERYKDELIREIPEVDQFFGVWDFDGILHAAGTVYYPLLQTERFLSTPAHYAYLKISEGCNRHCSFCAIPGIRGPQQSVSIDNLLTESENLANQGVRELILVAQDLTSYGTDLYRKHMLPQLLKELVNINGIEWIRLHYAYPTGFPEEVLDIMASEKKICRYLDIPVQHIADSVLNKMNRGHNREKLEGLLMRMREKIPGVAIRSTVMTGFPGETEKAYEELKSFISSFRFDRLGVFAYSHEDGTPAGTQFRDRISQKIKDERAAELMAIQQEISLELNTNKIGEEMTVIIDRIEKDHIIARSEFDSPEVDQEVLIKPGTSVAPGQFCQVRITGAEAFDLNAELI